MAIRRPAAVSLDLTNYLTYVNGVYRPLFSNRDRIQSIMGGAGSGKSVYAAQNVLLRLLMTPGIRATVVRKVFRSHLNSTYALLKQTIEDFRMSRFFSFTTSPLSITNKFNESTVNFLGCDDVEKLKSLLVNSTIWVEEATELTQDEFEQVNLRLRGDTTAERYHQIILTYNPISVHSWLKSYFWDQELEDCLKMKTTYLDNPYLGEAYVKQLQQLEKTNPELYRVYCLGEWGSVQGQIFQGIEWVDKIPDSITEDKPRSIGLDFGFTDPTACVDVFKDDKTFWVQEKFYKTQLTFDQIHQELLLADIPKTAEIFADAARPEGIEALRQKGWNIKPCRKGKDSVITGINFIKDHNLKITKDSSNLRKELNSYSWKTNNGVEIDEPVDINNHLIDSLRYATFSKWFKQNNLIIGWN